MGTKITLKDVMAFGRMNVFQKQKLKDENPARYQALLAESNKQFSTQTDQDAAKILVGGSEHVEDTADE
jgi:hypothetical protein